ncbi:cache domain-containing protein, partial [Desulfovibrio sp. OttesenSCG-928-G15]|nr:cache domain-containing protein [Desulfovibrio sp. OttesenSCG-928-G15]
MRLTIFSKVALMLVFSILFVVSPLLFYINTLLTEEFTHTQRETMQACAYTVKEKLQGYSDSLSGLLWQTTRRVDLQKAVADRNEKDLLSILGDLQKHSEIDMITLSDAKGDVIVRSHSPKKGDSVAKQINVRKSQAGELLTVGFEGGTAVAFSIRGGAPVHFDGKLVGVVTAGMRLDQSAFVDAIKKDINAEVTFFKKNVRIATTLHDAKGDRMTGTTMENKDILDTVLTRGEAYSNNRILLGNVPYGVRYEPLKSAEGENIGMLFIGVPASRQENLLKTVMTNITASAVGIAVVLGLLGIFAARFIITKPLARVSNVIADLVDDKAELSYRLDTSSRDEIAGLSHQVNRLTGKVESMLGNISGFKNMVNAMPDPVFVVNSDYTLLLANMRVCEIAGARTPEDLIGKDINTVLKLNLYGTDHCPLRDTIRQGVKSISAPFPLIINGQERQMRAQSDVMHDLNGDVAGYVQTLSDITDIVNHEHTLAEQMERMAAVNAKVAEIAASVNDSASQIQSQTVSVQDAASNQSQVMQQTLAAVQQMNETIMEIAGSAGRASEQANAGNQRAKQGEAIMNNAMAAIDTVRAQAASLSENLGVLGRQAEDIGQILNVISDIADQTNLLALNAAIEAARA